MELYLMPVYLFSFCVSIFYPFYRDALVFIVHRCHHCLMDTTCKGSKRMHGSQREMLQKMGSSWLECPAAFCPGTLGQGEKRKTQTGQQRMNDGVED